MEVRKILRIRFFFPPQSSEPMIRITDDFLQSVNLEKKKRAELLLKPAVL